MGRVVEARMLHKAVGLIDPFGHQRTMCNVSHVAETSILVSCFLPSINIPGPQTMGRKELTGG